MKKAIIIISCLILSLVIFAACQMTVQSVSIEQEKLEMKAGEEVALDVEKNPTDAEIVWSSSDDKIATVQDGTVTAVAGGEATITATIQGSEISDTCTVLVTQELENISLDKTDVLAAVGEELLLTPTISPQYESSKIIWSTSDEKIATVQDGRVNIVGEGIVIITARLESGDSATCTIRVKKEVQSVTLDHTSYSVRLGSVTEFKLTATVLPEDAYDKTLTWSSSDETVAVVEDGTVRILAVGNAVITAKTSNNKTAVCELTVSDSIKVESARIAEESKLIELVLGESDSASIVYELQPADAAVQSIEFVSDNLDIAQVDQTGLVTAVGIGECEITMTVDGKFTDTAHVKVEAAPLTVSISTTMGEFPGGGYEIANAMDGDLNTIWHSWGQLGEDKYILLTLNRVQSISFVEIYNRIDNNFVTSIQDLEIFVSIDGETYSSCGKFTATDPLINKYNFTPVNCKYIKLLVTKTTSGNEDVSTAIAELKIGSNTSGSSAQDENNTLKNLFDENAESVFSSSLTPEAGKPVTILLNAPVIIDYQGAEIMPVSALEYLGADQADGYFLSGKLYASDDGISYTLIGEFNFTSENKDVFQYIYFEETAKPYYKLEVLSAEGKGVSGAILRLSDATNKITVTSSVAYMKDDVNSKIENLVDYENISSYWFQYANKLPADIFFRLPEAKQIGKVIFTPWINATVGIGNVEIYVSPNGLPGSYHLAATGTFADAVSDTEIVFSEGNQTVQYIMLRLLDSNGKDCFGGLAFRFEENTTTAGEMANELVSPVVNR